MSTLPPGQRAIRGFPRFGTHLQAPPPAVPAAPELRVEGAVREPVTLALTALADLPRRELDADFQCVAGWSATGLRWEGVPFAAFYDAVVAPVARPGVTHLEFGGLDGYRVAVLLEDALADDVLLAEHLDGAPLDGDHGAPLRLVSPRQYGFVNAKHVDRIALLTAEPRDAMGAATRTAQLSLRGIGYGRFVRGRVWEQERHPFLPGFAVRLLSRRLIGAIGWLSRRGGSPRPPAGSA